MKIYLVRHGEPDYANDSLTEKGRREAEILADRLCKEPADAYYVSPLGRAQATAMPTLSRLGCQAITLPWLEEYSAVCIDPVAGEKGVWDWMPQYWTICPELFDRKQWTENSLLRTGNAEAKYRKTIEGFDSLMEEYGYKREGMLYRTENSSRARIVLFCHFGISMVILSHLLGLSPIVLLHGTITAPASVTTVVSEERKRGEVWFRCTGIGDVSHLFAADEPVSRSGQFKEYYDELPFSHAIYPQTEKQ